MDGQGPVPDPGEPVVPVPLAAGLLGQAQRGGGDRRAGGLVGEQLEGHRRTVDHLPPPPAVGGPAQPALPERRGVVGQPVQLARRQRPWLAAHRLEHHAAAALALAHGERRPQPVSGPLDRRPALALGPPAGGVQGQVHAVAAEHRAGLRDLHGVRGPAVVEPGLQVHHELHAAPGHPQVSHQPVPAGGPALDDRHEVQHLADPVGGHEPGDQHGRVWQVQLPGDVVVGGWRDPEVAAAVGVEQRRENAGRVEPRAAEEVHSAVSGHQRRGLQVPDEPVITDVRVTVHVALLRFSVHGRSFRRAGGSPPMEPPSQPWDASESSVRDDSWTHPARAVSPGIASR